MKARYGTNFVRTTASGSRDPRPVAINEAHIDLGVSQQVDRYCNWHYRHQHICLITFSRPSFSARWQMRHMSWDNMQLSYQARSRILWKCLDLYACKTLHQSTTASTSEAKPGVERMARVVSGSAVARSQNQIRIRPELIERSLIRDPVGLAG